MSKYKIGKKFIFLPVNHLCLVDTKSKHFPDNIAKGYTDINNSLITLNEWKIKKIPIYSSEGNGNLLSNIFSLRQDILYRTIEIQNGISSLVNCENLLAAIIMVRCLIETSAIAMDLLSRLEEAVIKKSGSEELNQDVLKVLLANRWKEFGKEYEAQSILKSIDKIDKRLFDGKQKPVRKCYEELSEFAHPNWAGVSGYFIKENRNNMQYFSLPIADYINLHEHIIYGCNSLSLIIMIFKSIDDVILDIIKMRYSC